MSWKSLFTAVVVLALMPLAARSAPQDLPRNNTGENEVFASVRPRALTPYEQFAQRLKLDSKTQVPQVEQILSEASKEAAPVGQQMLRLRQQLVNLSLANKPEEEKKQVVDAYTTAAAKMAGIEARAFAKVYAMLKPNQQSNAPQAFAIMAGMFQPPAPRGGQGRGQRGGGDR